MISELVLIGALGAGTFGQPSEATASGAIELGMQRFEAGDIEGSVEEFDRAIEIDDHTYPYLWQRGISLYYLQRWDDCIRQFVSHRAVNPNDVENAAWHFLCLAKRDGIEAARAALLPVGPDARKPMAQVYELYAARSKRSAVVQAMEAEGAGAWARFYGHLYLGLLAEVEGDAERARRHIVLATEQDFPHYMAIVARVHCQRRGWC